MGCDIHVVVEQKFGGEWVGVHACPLVREHQADGETVYHWWSIEDRNYERFCLMAGVRGDGPDPRGMPDDASTLAHAMATDWGCDGHSHSWLTAKELIPILLETSGDADRKALAEALMRGLEAGEELVLYRWLGISRAAEEVRIVFWFDN